MWGTKLDVFAVNRLVIGKILDCSIMLENELVLYFILAAVNMD